MLSFTKFNLALFLVMDLQCVVTGHDAIGVQEMSVKGSVKLGGRGDMVQAPARGLLPVISRYKTCPRYFIRAC